MEGGDAMPGDLRDNIVMAPPKSFAPLYGVSTTKDAGDIASAESKKNKEAIKVKEEKAATAAAALEAQMAKEQATADKAKYDALVASTPETAAGKEEKAAKVAAHETK